MLEHVASRNVPTETFNISFEGTQNKQQLLLKYLHRGKEKSYADKKCDTTFNRVFRGDDL